jgi:hypothetical protein
MAVLQGAASFRGRGDWEHEWPDWPYRFANRGRVPWGMTSGLSADPPGGPPGPDPSLAPLKKSMKTLHGLSETGGTSGPISF